MKDRINKVITHEGLTPSKFADILGVQRSSISHILSGRNNPGLDFLNKVLTHFPNISGDWLITGQGNMLKKPGNPFKMPTLFDKTQSGTDSNKPNVNSSINENAENIESKPLMTEIEDVKTTQENRSLKMEGRQIERIIVFYSDKSFREYQPE